MTVLLMMMSTSAVRATDASDFEFIVSVGDKKTYEYTHYFVDGKTSQTQKHTKDDGTPVDITLKVGSELPRPKGQGFLRVLRTSYNG